MLKSYDIVNLVRRENDDSHRTTEVGIVLVENDCVGDDSIHCMKFVLSIISHHDTLETNL